MHYTKNYGIMFIFMVQYRIIELWLTMEKSMLLYEKLWKFDLL